MSFLFVPTDIGALVFSSAKAVFAGHRKKSIASSRDLPYNSFIPSKPGEDRYV
jgi:hypothetical protein